MLNELDLEAKMAKMRDRELLEFIAREVYEHSGRITAIEGRDRRAYGIAGFLGAFVATIGYFIQLWVVKK